MPQDATRESLASDGPQSVAGPSARLFRFYPPDSRYSPPPPPRRITRWPAVCVGLSRPRDIRARHESGSRNGRDYEQRQHRRRIKPR